SGEVAAAADRLITLHVSAERPHGIFDSLPAEYSSSSDLAAALRGAATQHYGHAFRRFVTRLAKRRSRDERKLRSWIGRRLSEFRQAVAADLNDGSKLRVA